MEGGYPEGGETDRVGEPRNVPAPTEPKCEHRTQMGKRRVVPASKLRTELVKQTS